MTLIQQILIILFGLFYTQLHIVQRFHPVEGALKLLLACGSY